MGVDYSDGMIKRKAVEMSEKGSLSPAKTPVRAAAAIMTIFSVLGAFHMAIVFVINNKWFYMFVLCVGCTLVFATTTGINLCVMLAVPDANRSVAIAVNSVFIHAFGDVPSPVVAGLLKDTLAPACNANGDDDTVISSDGCRANSNGLRLCMLLITLWLAWSIFFFSLVWRFS